ncbi:transglycosylase SLT domain-containing protein [Brevundimonas sp.]|uniref:lytic transglycosylase domain-containing protein n=1 Tax=Brevundimonas sp. TaxID=1871086 RepID=UPI0025BD3237|nr:transglycosylase SLT domain-containing protein [Brevundimonas sp.]
MTRFMIVTALATVLAATAPLPQSLNSQPTPYASAPSYQARVLSDADTALFRQGLAAARARDVGGARMAASQISNPTARRLVEWALIDTSASQLSYGELAQAAQTMARWPRGDSRRTAMEASLDLANPGPDAVLAAFAQTPPVTIQGAIALADALEQRGRRDEARDLIRDWWRTRSFDDAQQSRILNRWPGVLTTDDHDARLSMLLLGPHGPATRAMTGMASPDMRAVAQAAMALRTAYSPETIVAGLTPAQAMHPAVVLERVRILRAANRQSEAFPLLAALPAAPTHKDGQDALWRERRNYFLDALRFGNPRAAYDAMAGHGFPSGDRKVDGEFFAGWAALTRLNDPVTAARHFQALREMSSTPITQGRALYWLGRAAEARGDQAAAQAFYAEGGRHIQSFYGQLAAEKAGITTLVLPGDPAPTPDDVARFEGDELVRALRILGETGEMSLYRVFAYAADDQLPTAADLALLMDMTRGYGETFTAMMVGRAASQRGFLMPERQYPVRMPPPVAGAAPLPFTLAITRQESSFDPRATSGANARGMMQFVPATGAAVARRLGLPFTAEKLYDPDFNMTLGSYHLGETLSGSGGSYLLSAVAHNAGAGRINMFVGRCGDPRGGQVDPADFIECVPFSETRDYMMRVLENMAIYKARLNGGSAPLTPSADLRAGAPAGPRPYTADTTPVEAN